MARVGATKVHNGTSKKNYIINGLADFRQRSATGVAIDATPAYRVHDRFLTYVNNLGFFNSAAHGPTSLVDPQGVTVNAMNTNADASSASAKYFTTQRIESLNSQELVGGKLSLSFLMKNVNFTDVSVNFYYPNTKDSFGGGQTLFHTTAVQVFAADANVKEVKFEDITVDSNVADGLAIEIVFEGYSIGVGGDAPITKIMLNEGEAAAPFQRAGDTIGAEFDSCQRYYQKSWAIGTTVGTAGSIGANIWQRLGVVLTDMQQSVDYYPMRVAPTVTVYASSDGEVAHISTDQGNREAIVPTVTESRYRVDLNEAVSSTSIQWHHTLDAEM
jgi:hypothetical protein